MESLAHARQNQRIQIDTGLSGPLELLLRRTPPGPGRPWTEWEARGVDGLGRIFHNRYRRIEELVAFLKVVEGLGANGGAN